MKNAYVIQLHSHRADGDFVDVQDVLVGSRDIWRVPYRKKLHGLMDDGWTRDVDNWEISRKGQITGRPFLVRSVKLMSPKHRGFVRLTAWCWAQD